MASGGPHKKMQCPRFTETELMTLVEEVDSRASVITGKLDSRITAEKKNKAWEEVAVAVIAVSEL